MNSTPPSSSDPGSRTVLLCEQLVKHGLVLRPDSRLCHAYIHGSLGDDWDLDRVVRECCMMHWLHTHTNYQARIYQAYSYFSYMFSDGRMVHEFIRNSIHPHIKAETILAHGGIPEKWPWLPDRQALPVHPERRERVRSTTLLDRKKRRLGMYKGHRYLYNLSIE